MQKGIKNLLGIMALSASTAFGAINSDAIDLPSIPVAQFRSNPGEQLEDFLARVGGNLRAFSKNTGYETCAAIGTDGESFGLNVVTSNGHVGCVVRHSNVPAGMHSIGETIHSHGQGGAFSANRADKVMLGVLRITSIITIGGQDTEAFSADDYRAPGYLVTKRGLIHQKGKGTDCFVGELAEPDLDAAPVLPSQMTCSLSQH